MVREVTTDGNGKATGVSYINKEDRKEYQLKGKTVILAASACSSARILLNSKSSQHPNGLGNSSDMTGKYLHDSTGSSRAFFVPDLMNRKTYNEDGVGGMHVYSPWWLDNKNLDFPRGYHIEVWGGLGMPSYGIGFGAAEMNKYIGETVGGYGDKLREDVKKFYGSMIGVSGRGECIAREDNYCEIDPTTVDEWGIPVLRFNYTWSDHERKQARHMHNTFEEIMHNVGGIALGDKPGADQDYGLLNPGRIIHEVGTTRMGDDPKKSVVNKFQQMHDVDNVSEAIESSPKYYGRTTEEMYLDDALLEEKFLTVHELETLVVLCDLILPANDQFGSAVDAGVPEFIEFISKDIPKHQLPLRGGIMWLDNRANKRFNKVFKSCNAIEHKQLADEIAYPDKAAPELSQGVEFFTLVRDLTLTGYYTTKMGVDDLGYKGNQPNVWDGVPDDVLKEHGLSYDEEWLAKCVDQSTRNETAQWDDDGNLIT
ncbi:2-PD dehydrogenase) [Durusdinium trenchii]|uniref:2-PD dehydrogenase n=1 Tax=Durusdinium trenchii TaxID=1381693 RepID=A0ABP0KEY6_9DINO